MLFFTQGNVKICKKIGFFFISFLSKFILLNKSNTFETAV